MNLDSYFVERRSDGAVIVRVASRDRGRDTLPEAVFAFRDGDPQYQYWEQVLRERRAGMPSACWEI
jgi:hypothetical protein